MSGEPPSPGKLRHIAISYHDTADVLDQILTEHPEIEAVQIALNYFDWDARLIQARKCYETIRKYGKLVIVMEPVKGGMLAKVPAEAERRMRELRPEDSAVSWALRFAAGLDGVLAVLSGMSNTAQMEDNVSTFQRFQPLTEAERLNAPAIRLSATDIDLSQILAKKKKAKQDITVTNTGRSPLQISKLQVFHPAVGVDLKKTVLQPGESTRLRVTVVKRNIGKKRRHLRLLMITNDPMQPKVEINIKAK